LNEADVQLVHAARAGDRAAFGQLVERFKGPVYATAMAITGNGHEAQELTQETFVRALMNLPRLDDPTKFPPWLRSITYTVGRDVRRQAARERKHLEVAALGRAQEAPPAHAGLAQREASDLERALLADLVAALPQNVRMALDLKYREGLSYAEIGEALGVPASTVRGLLFRGTKALRTKMKPMLRPGSPSPASAPRSTAPASKEGEPQ